jgi:hypothetical protein
VIGFSEAVNEIRVMDRLMSTNMAVGDRLPRAQIRSGNPNMSGARYIMLRCPQIETSSTSGQVVILREGSGCSSSVIQV